jgi:hypothetical protein
MAPIRRSLPHLKSNTAVTFSVSQSIRWESDPADFAVRLDYGDLLRGFNLPESLGQLLPLNG